MVKETLDCQCPKCKATYKVKFDWDKVGPVGYFVCPKCNKLCNFPYKSKSKGVQMQKRGD